MNNDKDSLLYVVDRLGRVWYLSSPGENYSTRGSINSSSTQQSHPSVTSQLKWVLLPNPTKIDIKRVSSRGGVLWGIGSDHQIYIYVHKQDVSVRVREETYENQRWNPIGGFCSQLLPTDRSHFSSEDGLTSKEKSSIKLPSEESWIWESEWQIENTFNNELLDQGWTYAVDFPATYHTEKSWNSCVRRRKWFRIRRFIGYNKWLRIPSIHEDHTQEPFTDVSVNTFGFSKDIHCVWTVTVLGQVYFRAGVTPLNPEGTHWKATHVQKGLEACQVTVAGNGQPFVVSWTGSCLLRTGITPYNLAGDAWVEINGPPGGLIQVSAGEKSIWAITRDRKCWILKGNLQSAVQIVINSPGTPFEWSEIPGKLKSISVSNNDLVVLGMNDEDNVIYARVGITHDQIHGQGRKQVFQRASWDTLSIASLESSNDATDSGNGDSDSLSLDSVRPDYPENFKLDDAVSDQEDDIPLCWVDGGCLSFLKSATENEIEIGPWRDTIFSGIQSLKDSQEKYSYPDAIDKDDSEWKGKSTSARILQHGQESHWIRGELEIVNNDTLVFHKTLTHTWLCGLRDILSIIRSRELTHSFTIRIRNAIEAGVADFVSFKFGSEKELDDWYQTIAELSAKNPEEFTLGNTWVTTTNGELYECGLIKMADSAIGADMVVPSDSGYNTHHPLIKGFLPGSTLKIDISVPTDAEKFMLNLEGKNLIAFHFNPRFPDAVVVRNTKRHGEWGIEERDGVFPFRPSHKYTVTIECADTHFITTVAIERKKFIFQYKHRVLPRFITNFSAGGNVNILGIRYDPKTGDNASQQEFVTLPAPGHFWKVESSPNGFIWAIGFDSNVWMHANSLKHKKSEVDRSRIVTDEQVCYIYENQRWNPLTGFGSHGLPTDRSPWSDETGRQALEKDKVRLPSSNWNWLGDWEIDYSTPDGVDQSGWQYAIDFPASYHPYKRINDFVRRRRWKKICRYSAPGPWIQVTGAKLIDLCIQMNEDCDWEVLGVCQNGDAVVRCGITPEFPMGTNWESVPCEKPLISISGSYGQRPWAIGKDGFAYIRYGHNWQLLDRPKETPLKSVKVGPSGIWAIGKNNTLYKRTHVLPILPEGQDWCKVSDGVTQVSLGLGEEVWGLLKKGELFQSTLSRRIGIGQNNPNGIGWETVAEGPWTHFSLSGGFRRNR